MWRINRENVVETLERAGGRLESRLLVSHFLSGIKSETKCKNPRRLEHLREVLNDVAKKDDDVWVIKKRLPFS